MPRRSRWFRELLFPLSALAQTVLGQCKKSEAMSESLPSISVLNQWCAAHKINLRFLSIGTRSPRLISQGKAPLTTDSLARAEAIARTLRTDEWHALADIHCDGFPEQIHYQVVTYSQMLALREAGTMPTGLSATVLPINHEKQTLLLQKRSASSHLYPGYLSLLGGGYAPAVDDAGDGANPRTTAERECFEESNVQLTIPDNCLVAITQETDVGAIQINYLGIASDFANAKADEQEGLLVEVPVPGEEAIADLKNHTDLLKGCLAAYLSQTTCRVE
ncbi:hypothetical protein M5M_14460 [Simiduia agarivorans SA1 = DSM 21679]|uniref:Uncharacterized protein n=2 Tax=Simiduia TaxID=447467 RepID=K4KPI2_SIMAS|nr:hypothetical protein M5M_14460 [Simiduia agarivorans SA1 = DSM 21679]